MNRCQRTAKLHNIRRQLQGQAARSAHTYAQVFHNVERANEFMRTVAPKLSNRQVRRIARGIAFR